MPYSVSKVSNVSYGSLSHQKLDRYNPSGAPSPKPGIVLVAGGGFSSCNYTNMDARCRKITSELGAVSVTIRYAVPSSGGYAMQTLADIILAVNWLKARSGVDPNRVGVWGNSAGSLIAAHAAMSGGPAKVFVGEAGPYNIDPPSSAATVTWLNGYSAHDASPIFNVNANAKPAFLAHGSADTVVPPSESVAMAAAYDAAGVPYVHHIHSGGHDGPLITAEKNALWAAQKLFLQTYL